MRISPTAARFAAIALIALAAAANAQTPKRGTVLVTVRDSTGTVIPNAELTLTRGLKDILAHGRTDDAGEATLAYEVSDSTELQVTMRKIGYVRTDHFFDGAPSGKNWLAITVAPPKSNTLAPVKVTAQADVRRKSYYLNADDIENADGYLDNGWEVVKRLRPDMLTSRGGCPGVQQIWVNGKWIRLPLPASGIAAARARVGVPPRARFSYAAVSVLSDISPEHIQEIIYHDCWESSVTNVGAINAMMVILKPGVVYQENVGSFVDDLPAKPDDKKK